MELEENVLLTSNLWI